MSQKGIRTITAGDAGVGKTSLILKSTGEDLTSDKKNTIGATYTFLPFNLNGNTVCLDIWDTGGQEKFRSVANIYFREAVAGIFLFDITSRKSYENLSSWIDEFLSYARRENVIFIVANKCDLMEKREVDLEEAENWAKNSGYSFFQTSALTGMGVKELMQSVALGVYNLSVVPSTGISIEKDNKNNNQEKKNCC